MRTQEFVAQRFRSHFNREPVHVVRAPARVNLLGEHVDYNDGFVLPVAIDRYTTIAFAPTDSPLSTLHAADFDQEVSFRLPSPDGLNFAWAKYPAGVMWALNEAGYDTPNMQAVFSSETPRGAGLSSSASVEVAFALAWSTLGGWKIPSMEMALICQRAENEFVGVHCGIMDQFAVACGEKGKAMLLDCRSLEYRSMPLPKDYAIVVADTSVRRALANSAYNERRAACEEAARILGKSLRDVGAEEFNLRRGELPAGIEKRARHVVEEIARTKQAIERLQRDDVVGFGQLMNECHASLRDLYEVSAYELDAMAESARNLEGCAGARLTGAGFGGCVVALVKRDQVETFAKNLLTEYESRTRLHPEIYICESSNGAALAE
jgi:galactokinase